MTANAHSAWKERPTSITNRDVVNATDDVVNANDLESLWPDLRADVVGYLLKRGASREVVDEVVQDTAVRLLGCWQRIDHSRPLGPLANKIAWNLLVDHYRRTPALPVAEFPDKCSVYDIEEHRVLRARLQAAAEGLRRLREQDRAVLLAEIGVGRITSNRMARLRARRRLQAIVDQVSSSLAVVPITVRRILGWGQTGGAGDALNAAATAGILFVVSLVALSLDSGHDAQAQTVDPPALIQPNVRQDESGSRRKMSPVDRRFDPNEAKPVPSASRGPGPTEGPSTQENDLHAQAGPARAEKGHGQGYVYVQVCLGEGTKSKDDDYGMTIVLFDGGQSGEEAAPACRYEDEGDDDG